MHTMTRTGSHTIAGAVALTVLMSPLESLAATVPGSLSYAAAQVVAPATAVPGLGGGGIVLLGLGLMLAAWLIRGKGIHLAVVLVVAGGLLVLGGGNRGIAQIIATSLSDPQGGTVQVLDGPQQFNNDSGSPIRITELLAPSCNDGPLDIPGIQPQDLCAAGLLLAADEHCSTDFPGCAPQQCVPDCSGKECGDDGCGGSCGSCGQDQNCQTGICVNVVPLG
jgi:hypothetical protein